MEDNKKKYELGSIVTAIRTFNRETITGEFGGFHLLDKSNPKSIVGVVHTPNGSYDVEPYSIESVISEDERIMKAPEKIYLQEPTKIRTERLYNNDVEYTRTDAFIEKAEKFLKDNLTEKDCKFNWGDWTKVKSGDTPIASLMRAFRNYMKG